MHNRLAHGIDNLLVCGVARRNIDVTGNPTHSKVRTPSEELPQRLKMLLAVLSVEHFLKSVASDHSGSA